MDEEGWGMETVGKGRYSVRSLGGGGMMDGKGWKDGRKDKEREGLKRVR